MIFLSPTNLSTCGKSLQYCWPSAVIFRFCMRWIQLSTSRIRGWICQQYKSTDNFQQILADSSCEHRAQIQILPSTNTWGSCVSKWISIYFSFSGFVFTQISRLGADWVISYSLNKNNECARLKLGWLFRRIIHIYLYSTLNHILLWLKFRYRFRISVQLIEKTSSIY